MKPGPRPTPRSYSNEGFTLIEIMIAVSIIGLLLALALPNWLKTRTRVQTDACIENLSQIETAKQLWGLEESKTVGDTPTEAELYGPLNFIRDAPRCPAGGTYEILAIGTNATCTIPGHVLPGPI
jgi:prepilin-type N-terminal cleavage/methylation domain-containing protein